MFCLIQPVVSSCLFFCLFVPVVCLLLHLLAICCLFLPVYFFYLLFVSTCLFFLPVVCFYLLFCFSYLLFHDVVVDRSSVAKLQVVRDSTPNQYMLLLIFKDKVIS